MWNRYNRTLPDIVGKKNLSYHERLQKLKSLEYRRIRGDMIEVYKMVHDKYDPCNCCLLILKETVPGLTLYNCTNQDLILYITRYSLLTESLTCGMVCWKTQWQLQLLTALRINLIEIVNDKIKRTINHTISNRKKTLNRQN